TARRDSLPLFVCRPVASTRSTAATAAGASARLSASTRSCTARHTAASSASGRVLPHPPATSTTAASAIAPSIASAALITLTALHSSTRRADIAGSSLTRVTTGRGSRLPACRAVLLAFGGVWLGHVAEHYRVEGSAGLVHELSHSVHLYMLPLGALLVVLAALTGVGWVRMAAALTHRLEHATDALARAFRGASPRLCRTVPAAPTAPSVGGRWLALALPLSVAQLVLYALQENLEHAMSHEAVP